MYFIKKYVTFMTLIIQQYESHANRPKFKLNLIVPPFIRMFLDEYSFQTL